MSPILIIVLLLFYTMISDLCYSGIPQNSLPQLSQLSNPSFHVRICIQRKEITKPFRDASSTLMNLFFKVFVKCTFSGSFQYSRLGLPWQIHSLFHFPRPLNTSSSINHRMSGMYNSFIWAIFLIHTSSNQTNKPLSHFFSPLDAI